MEKQSAINYKKVVLIIIGLLCLSLGAKGYSWSLALGALLIGSVLLSSGVSEIIEYVRAITNNQPQGLARIYLQTGIIQSLLTNILIVGLVGLILYGVLWQKALDTVLHEVFKSPRQVGINLAYIGFLAILTAAHHIVGSWLEKDFSFINVLYSFKIMVIGIGGILLFLLGIFYLFA